MKASGKLVKGEVYTRRQLKELFDISNQTISKSIFQPAGHESVFVFVNFSDSPTEPERDTALADPVVAIREDADDVSICQLDGQFQDNRHLIEFHRQREREVLVFGRNPLARRATPAYRYLGTHEYICGETSRPVRLQLGGASNMGEIIHRDVFDNLDNRKTRLIGETIKQRLMVGIIQDLQTLGREHMESPESLGLTNVWEEICVRVQSGDECCFRDRNPKELEELERNDMTPESYGLQDASEVYYMRPMQFAKKRIETLGLAELLALWLRERSESDEWFPRDDCLKEELAFLCWDCLVQEADEFSNERVDIVAGSYDPDGHYWLDK